MFEVEAVGPLASRPRLHQLDLAGQGGHQRGQGLGLILVARGDADDHLDLDRRGLRAQGAQGGQGLGKGAGHPHHVIVDGRRGRVQADAKVGHPAGEQGLTQPGVNQRPGVGGQAHAKAHAPGQADQPQQVPAQGRLAAREQDLPRPGRLRRPQVGPDGGQAPARGGGDSGHQPLVARTAEVDEVGMGQGGSLAQARVRLLR